MRAALGIACAAVAVLGVCAQTGRDLKLEPVRTTTLPDGKVRWGLVIGVSSYENAPPPAQLKFAHRDAENFGRFLRGPEGGAIPASNLRVLTNSQATLASIRSALHTWLPASANAGDIVYFYFAGHGVIAEQNEGYFVAHDSDPQNLHATGLSFREVSDTLGRLKAGMIVLLADACHAGSIGWTADSAAPSRAQDAIQSILPKDRSFLNMLASRPSERSFEDSRWDGGVFTFALLSGLRGAAERDADGLVRASELIDYVSRVVPEQTGSQQNPRVGGNFEARVPLAVLKKSASGRAPAPTLISLDVRGPAGASIYLDDAFRGALRPSGDLRIESLAAGPHRLAIDFPTGQSLEQVLSITSPQTLQIDRLPGYSLVRLDALVRAGKVLDAGGAWDYYSKTEFAPFAKPAADAMMTGALEEMGQACVGDYVQSTAAGLKGRMLLNAVQAYDRLKKLRPADRGIEARRVFCQGRAEIAQGKFAEAVNSLNASLAIDPSFACAHNALGVALGRLNRREDARRSFEAAAKLTPEWSLPFFQIAQQYVAVGDIKGAVPYLEKAARFNPRSAQAKWTLLRAYRVTGRGPDFERAANELLQLNPNYAPAYLEIGAFREARGEYGLAAQAYDTYLTLAPNFEDSIQVRGRAEKNRQLSTRRAPSLFKK
jgi:Flp pilus assembly protein TadD